MKIFTKKKMKRKLREIDKLLRDDDILKCYSSTHRLLLYSRIKAVLLDKEVL